MKLRDSLSVKWGLRRDRETEKESETRGEGYWGERRGWHFRDEVLQILLITVQSDEWLFFVLPRAVLLITGDQTNVILQHKLKIERTFSLCFILCLLCWWLLYVWGAQNTLIHRIQLSINLTCQARTSSGAKFPIVWFKQKENSRLQPVTLLTYKLKLRR